MFLLYILKQKKVKKERYTRQYNVQIVNKIIFFKYRTRQVKATQISKFLILIAMAGIELLLIAGSYP